MWDLPYMLTFFEATGVAPCWQLERIQVQVTSALASLSELEPPAYIHNIKWLLLCGNEDAVASVLKHCVLKAK